ncbi:TetR/AcrR family transcriptional regulator [Algiphilus aromaticivorans]|uniref:TetR/AcrR family transcriptional regulator n=1 Tax=Algiphilus aromaticivorans TaxID=382454 RepID=UPI0006947BDE|nr:TetR/AcrR family transcriptional regulator [Algiphilus aromaticivorans]
MSAAVAAPSRTQAERRAATRRRLLDAAAEVLVAQGYARASVQAIVSQAGLSQGALFGHFDTRLDLMRAVADDVGDRLISAYGEAFRQAGTTGHEDWLRAALELVRSNCRSRLHQAWFELLMAARSDLNLHVALAPAWSRHMSRVQRIAAQLMPAAATRMGADFEVSVDAAVTMLHGEAVDNFVRADAAADEARMRWLCESLRMRLEAAPAAPRATGA